MEIVRLVRALLSISQRDLAKRSGISVRELARIESGEVYPRREAAAAVSRAFASIIIERAGKPVEGEA